MKYSIKRQMATVFIGIVMFILLAVFVMNSRFLEEYYVQNKMQVLTNIYQSLNKLMEENKEMDSESLNKTLGPLVEKSNVSLIVTDATGSIRIKMRTDSENEELKTRLVGYRFNINQEESTLLKSSDNYELRKAKDPRNKMEYLEMWGNFSNGNVFLFRSPLESIRESVMIFNRFLMYIGVGVILISIVIIWYFSKKITDPILELAMLSEKMADLDFDAKYTSGGKNEIGILGCNFNKMSQRLETTISELKSANNELQKDIEKKEQIETMRTEFLGNVSHELKTPLTRLQLSTALVRHQTGDIEPVKRIEN